MQQHEGAVAPIRPDLILPTTPKGQIQSALSPIQLHPTIEVAIEALIHTLHRQFGADVASKVLEGCYDNGQSHLDNSKNRLKHDRFTYICKLWMLSKSSDLLFVEDMESISRLSQCLRSVEIKPKQKKTLAGAYDTVVQTFFKGVLSELAKRVLPNKVSECLHAWLMIVQDEVKIACTQGAKGFEIKGTEASYLIVRLMKGVLAGWQSDDKAFYLWMANQVHSGHLSDHSLDREIFRLEDVKSPEEDSNPTHQPPEEDEDLEGIDNEDPLRVALDRLAEEIIEEGYPWVKKSELQGRPVLICATCTYYNEEGLQVYEGGSHFKYDRKELTRVRQNTKALHSAKTLTVETPDGDKLLRVYYCYLDRFTICGKVWTNIRNNQEHSDIPEMYKWFHASAAEGLTFYPGRYVNGNAESREWSKKNAHIHNLMKERRQERDL